MPPIVANLDLGQFRNYQFGLLVGDPDEIHFEQGDITQWRVDAIVNAANSELAGGGGVDGSIHRAGGPAIMEECRRIRAEQGRLAPGDAVATTAGRLLAMKVIHTVGPIWQGGVASEATTLASCYRASIALADRHGFTSIAFPAISTGVYGYPVEHAAKVAVSTVIEAVRQARHVLHCHLVLFDRSTLDTFVEVATEINQEGKYKFHVTPK